MENLLKAKKIRITPFRLAVLDVFDKSQNALRLEQIEQSLGDHDRITLYRTIKVFIEKGVLHEITMVGDVKKLAMCSNECKDDSHHHEHIHFHCTICDETFCLEMDALPKISYPGFQINQLEIQTSGVCETCQA